MGLVSDVIAMDTERLKKAAENERPRAQRDEHVDSLSPQANVFYIRDDSYVQNTLELANVNQTTQKEEKKRQCVNMYSSSVQFELDTGKHLCTTPMPVFLFHVGHVYAIV